MLLTFISKPLWSIDESMVLKGIGTLNASNFIAHTKLLKFTYYSTRRSMINVIVCFSDVAYASFLSCLSC